MVSDTAAKLLCPERPPSGRRRSELEWREALTRQADRLHEIANSGPKAAAVPVAGRVDRPWRLVVWFTLFLASAMFGLFSLVAVAVGAQAPLPFVVALSVFLCGLVLTGISWAVLAAWLRTRLL